MDTQFEEPGDDELISDDKAYRKTMLHLHRENREDNKLLKRQVWGDVHADPPTQGVVRDVDYLMKERQKEKDHNKWFRRYVLAALTTIGLGALSAYVASHWH